MPRKSRDHAEDWISRPKRVVTEFRGYVATKNHHAIEEQVFDTPSEAIAFIAIRVKYELEWTKTATSPAGVELWQGGHPRAMAEDREIRASRYKKSADPSLPEELTPEEWWDRYYVEPVYEDERVEIEGAEYVRGLPGYYIVREDS